MHTDASTHATANASTHTTATPLKRLAHDLATGNDMNDGRIHAKRQRGRYQRGSGHGDGGAKPATTPVQYLAQWHALVDMLPPSAWRAMVGSDGERVSNTPHDERLASLIAVLSEQGILVSAYGAEDVNIIIRWLPKVYVSQDVLTHWLPELPPWTPCGSQDLYRIVDVGVEGSVGETARARPVRHLRLGTVLLRHVYVLEAVHMSSHLCNMLAELAFYNIELRPVATSSMAYIPVEHDRIDHRIQYRFYEDDDKDGEDGGENNNPDKKDDQNDDPLDASQLIQHLWLLVQFLPAFQGVSAARYRGVSLFNTLATAPECMEDIRHAWDIDVACIAGHPHIMDMCAERERTVGDYHAWTGAMVWYGHLPHKGCTAPTPLAAPSISSIILESLVLEVIRRMSNEAVAGPLQYAVALDDPLYGDGDTPVQVPPMCTTAVLTGLRNIFRAAPPNTEVYVSTTQALRRQLCRIVQRARHGGDRKSGDKVLPLVRDCMIHMSGTQHGYTDGNMEHDIQWMATCAVMVAACKDEGDMATASGHELCAAASREMVRICRARVDTWGAKPFWDTLAATVTHVACPLPMWMVVLERFTSSTHGPAWAQYHSVAVSFVTCCAAIADIAAAGSTTMGDTMLAGLTRLPTVRDVLLQDVHTYFPLVAGSTDRRHTAFDRDRREYGVLKMMLMHAPFHALTRYVLQHPSGVDWGAVWTEEKACKAVWSSANVDLFMDATVALARVVSSATPHSMFDHRGVIVMLGGDLDTDRLATLLQTIRADIRLSSTELQTWQSEWGRFFHSDDRASCVMQVLDAPRLRADVRQHVARWCVEVLCTSLLDSHMDGWMPCIERIVDYARFTAEERDTTTQSLYTRLGVYGVLLRALLHHNP